MNLFLNKHELTIETNTFFKLRSESTFDRVLLTGKKKKNDIGENVYQVKSYTKILGEPDIEMMWWKRENTLIEDLY